ncbi:phosphotransferase [Micromonospora carbonacea]|uniref:phosphotransferase n=1 Tax=Micromonospora carbonacea TaxID=47853 RepID=UPI003332816A
MDSPALPRTTAELELRDVLRRLLHQASGSSPGTEQSVTDCLGDQLISVVRSHNTPSTIWRFRAGRQAYVLKAELGRGTTLRRELRWYLRAAAVGLPRGLFVLGQEGPAFTFLLLRQFGDTTTLDDAALAGRTADDLQGHLRRAAAMNATMFGRTQRGVPVEAVHGVAAHRIDKRVAEAMSHPYLLPLLTRRTVTVNGMPLQGLLRSWRNVVDQESAVRLLTPAEVGLIFGDLHCGNILVDGIETEVVDPRGGPLLPMAYDLGKLVQSVEGGYGAIMAGSYRLRRVTEDEYEIDVDMPPGYAALAPWLRPWLGDRRYQQALYQATQHFLAMLPHHASARRETLALALSGILQFERLREALDG